MNKKVIITFLGPSAAGKDTLAKLVELDLKHCFPECTCGNVVSDTTRPKRGGEREGKDYNFISYAQFNKNNVEGKYIDTTSFKEDWWYGIQKDSVKYDINLMVVNPEGLYNLTNIKYAFGDNVVIIPVFCDCGFFKRIIRSIKREKCFKFEFIRRAFADFDDFFFIKSMLYNYQYSVTLNTGKESLTYNCNYIVNQLKEIIGSFKN